MSRFGEFDDDEAFPGQWELYQANVRRAFNGKRGQRFLRELREALMALPEHKLIEGALCTVGAGKRRGELLAEAERDLIEARKLADQTRAEHPSYTSRYVPRLDLDQVEELDAHVAHDGEGVCAAGAFLWHQNVKNGMDPEAAFADLPLLLGTAGDQGDTVDMLADAADVARCIAWDIATRNDDTYSRDTPVQRWQRFVDWIDDHLTESPASI